MPVDAFKVGSVEMLVLYLLKQGDAHGYQLQQMLEEYSGGALTVKTASLYPILYKLEENGCITGRETFVQRKTPSRTGLSARVRIVYHLEPAGLQRLDELIGVHETFVNACTHVFEYQKERDSE